jgi:hypothetical protein
MMTWILPVDPLDLSCRSPKSDLSSRSIGSYKIEETHKHLIICILQLINYGKHYY